MENGECNSNDLLQSTHPFPFIVRHIWISHLFQLTNQVKQVTNPNEPYWVLYIWTADIYLPLIFIIYFSYICGIQSLTIIVCR